MLLEMRLRALGVIADAVLELGPGLTVVTGETGAGKTMVVTGLGLLMGGRADPAAVREGERTASVEGRVLVDPAGSVAARAAEAGAELDDGDVLIVSRTVSAEGRGRAHLGGRAVPAGLLAELSESLVTVHGQSDQLRLRAPARQREALDRFAGADLAEGLAAYRSTWQRLRHVEGRLEELVARARERSQEAELLRLGLTEVERVQPQPAEDVTLRAEASRLGHAEELRFAAEQAHLALTGDPDGAGSPGSPDVTALIAQARRALDQVAGHDEALAALAARLGEIGYLVTDVAAECASYASGVEADPARLAALEDRRAVLGALARAHGEGRVLPLNALARQRRLLPDRCEQILERAAALGWAARTERDGWVLARDAAQIQVADIYRAFVFDADAVGVPQADLGLSLRDFVRREGVCDSTP